MHSARASYESLLGPLEDQPTRVDSTSNPSINPSLADTSGRNKGRAGHILKKSPALPTCGAKAFTRGDAIDTLSDDKWSTCRALAYVSGSQPNGIWNAYNKPSGTTAYTLFMERNDMMNLLNQLWRDEGGQDLTEYALLLVLISLIAVASLKVAGQAVSDAFSNAAANLTTNT